MATGRSSFAKRQRDMAKKAKAEAKRQKRLGRSSQDSVADDDSLLVGVPDTAGTTGSTAGSSPDKPVSNDKIMEKVADLHRRYDDGLLDLDAFDEERALLMAQISID